MSDILSTVEQYWGFTGIKPKTLIAENEFGNLIIEDEQGQFWRLCPEDLYCDIIADDKDEYNELVKDIEFNQDWFMEAILEKAQEKYGALAPGFKFHLLEPGALGGKYSVFNIRPAPLEKMIQFSGELEHKRQRAGGKKVSYTPLVLDE